jgi:hypothetical protein
MRLRTFLQRAARFSAPARRAALGAALAGAGLAAAACRNDVNVTDPNTPSSGTFWQSASDANAGVVATYNALLQLGTFQRWQAFVYDLRSDIGTSRSPRPDFREIAFFRYPAGYDAEINVDIWRHSFTLVSRANQVIANVPNIAMPAAQRDAYVGEAKFLRGIGYFHLVNVFGGNVPLITGPLARTDQPASSDSAAIYAQLERDFADAAAALPVQTTAQSGGRATKGAAQGMLGKVQLQQRKWGLAAATLLPIINGQVGAYQLEPSYARLFTQTGNQSNETLFEVQMGSPQTCVPGVGVCGLNVIRMIGPCGIGFCDGEPTRWYFDQFRQERTTSGALDPRLDATIFYYKGDSTTLFNRTWRDRYGSDTTRIFWKKYSEYYIPNSTEQSWEAQINYKVLRLADVYLMYAEAVNEQGQTAAAYEWVNRVRRRASLADLRAGMTQAEMREEILRQRLLEFGLESQRWFDMRRQNLFADLTALRARDPDFASFTAGTSEVLPIPTGEINLNPNLRQNNGY